MTHFITRNAIFILTTVFIVALSITTYGKDFELFSPDKRIKIVVTVQDDIHYSVFLQNTVLLSPSKITLSVQNRDVLGERVRIVNSAEKSVTDEIVPVVKEKFARIKENYRELMLQFEGDFALIFRAYNEGVAYRFKTNFANEITVLSETVQFNFPQDFSVYFPQEESFHSHNERQYLYQPLSHISAEQLCSLPALIDTKADIKMLISESDLDDYPGLWLKGSGAPSLTGTFPAYPLEEKQTNDRNVIVTRRADYLAKTSGTRTFPWRFLIISENDGQLVTNQLSYLLAKPCQLKDTSWIKPGKVAWDWWNYNNVYGVDFRAGINTETYKYYIDFAFRYDLEYIILDEGWYKLGNLLDINPDINMEEIINYGKKKNVGIILWVIWKTLDDQLEAALDQFAKWGVRGIKVDFMQRDDQWMVNYYHKIAREAAKRHLLVDFHGAHKPAGLRRMYPNVLTYEGVQGLEHNKWSANSTPTHDVTIPFIRMVAGPMDYTPGAMINAQKKDFHPVFNQPMSQGTRCHQLALYVVFESPLQMLADSPTHYLKEPECMEFLSPVPTQWDDTIVLDANVAEYILIARKHEQTWYVGGLTNWDARDLQFNFSFLGPGDFKAVIFQDGINADRNGNDYKKVIKQVKKTDHLKIHLAPGGGWAAMITEEIR